jgi:hypothetical protein
VRRGFFVPIYEVEKSDYLPWYGYRNSLPTTSFLSRVSDPDPDQAFYLNADPAIHIHADPDPASHKSGVNLRTLS